MLSLVYSRKVGFPYLFNTKSLAIYGIFRHDNGVLWNHRIDKHGKRATITNIYIAIFNRQAPNYSKIHTFNALQ